MKTQNQNIKRTSTSEQPMHGQKIIVNESVKAFGSENWPATGRVWVRITPDGSAGLGWSDQPYTGTAAKAVRSEAAEAARRFAVMQVGEVLTVPTGYHPRHGMKTSTYLRVR